MHRTYNAVYRLTNSCLHDHHGMDPLLEIPLHSPVKQRPSHRHAIPAVFIPRMDYHMVQCRHHKV